MGYRYNNNTEPIYVAIGYKYNNNTIYLFIPRHSPPNGGWPTTKQTHALIPLIPFSPSCQA